MRHFAPALRATLPFRLLTGTLLLVGGTLCGLPAQASATVGLRIAEIATDKPVVSLAVRYAPGTSVLALLQDDKVLQRYTPAVGSPEGLVNISLQPGSGATDLIARAFDAQGQVLGDSEPVHLDPQAYAPEPLSIAARANQVTETLPSTIICSLSPAPIDDPLPGATVTVTLNGKPVQQTFMPRHGTLSLAPLPLQLGKNELRVEQSNGWGHQDTATLKAYNLGETIPASTYVLVDKENYTLYWVQNGALKSIYPIATGRPRTPTPVGEFVMGKKEVMAYPYTGWGVLRMLIYDIRPGGRRHWGGYAIHGTDQPSSIGKEASHGCVRMFNADVVKLSKEMPLETRVFIRPRLEAYVEAM